MQHATKCPGTVPHHQLHRQQQLPARACRGGSSSSLSLRSVQQRQQATSSSSDGSPLPATPPPQQQQQQQQHAPQQQQQQQQQQAPVARVNMWDYKPPWCQPWSILLSGSGAVAGSWQLFHTWWLTLPVSLGVVAWWVLFLVVVPASFQRYVEAAERQGIDWRREMMGGEE